MHDDFAREAKRHENFEEDVDEDKVTEVVKDAGDVYAAINNAVDASINNAADALKDVANPDNVKSISISIHRVALKDIPEDWTFEKIGEGDESSLIARFKVGSINITAHLAK